MTNLACPECRTSNLIKFGTKWSKNNGIRVKTQQYLCNHCGRVTIHPIQPQPRNNKGRFVPTKDTYDTALVNNTTQN